MPRNGNAPFSAVPKALIDMMAAALRGGEFGAVDIRHQVNQALRPGGAVPADAGWLVLDHIGKADIARGGPGDVPPQPGRTGRARHACLRSDKRRRMPVGMGAILRPWIRFPGQTSYTQGTASILVDAQGGFTWERRTGKTIYISIRSQDGTVESNRLILRTT